MFRYLKRASAFPVAAYPNCQAVVLPSPFTIAACIVGLVAVLSAFFRFTYGSAVSNSIIGISPIPISST